MTEMNRTQEEIRARIDKVLAEDQFLGHVAATPLLEFCEFDTIKDLLTEESIEAGQEAWDMSRDPDRNCELMFDHACDKSVNHRGISASVGQARAIAIAWLFVDDAFAEEVAELDYQNYGASALKAVAERVGGKYKQSYDEWNHRGHLDRMAKGEPCQHDCMDGCGV